MREGLAEALELDMEYPDAIEEFVRHCTVLGYGDSAWYAGQPGVYDQIVDDLSFGYRHFDYVRAGAFVRFLIDAYGIDKVKRFYRASCTMIAYDLAYEFSCLFGQTLREEETKFESSYVRCSGCDTAAIVGDVP